MASPAPVKYTLVGFGVSALVLALLQGLLAQQLDRAQINQMASGVAFNVRLGELALDGLPPAALRSLSGLPLLVAARPPTGTDQVLQAQSLLLAQQLCQRLGHCPLVLPSAGLPRGAWVELLSALEPVWLFVPLRSPQRFPPDPSLLALALVAGTLATTLLFLWWEVQRPLQELEEGLLAVGSGGGALPLAAQGTGAVRRLAKRFNSMVQRLELNDQERSLMLSGVAHDLKTPLTRLRLRLGLAGGEFPGDRKRAEADLDALERITGQFLLFAGGAEAEPAVMVNLDAWLAELSAPLESDQVGLDLERLERRVQPTALARAVGNLIDNCLSYGRLPLRLVLRSDLPAGEGFRIEVWDCGKGIGPGAWEQALVPFHRLDSARSGQGHCGLGLAIALRVAKAHGGSLEAIRSEEGFAVVLRGRSL
jgi:two-component system osmolarity sensor histidine kinase EnvZ